MTPRKRSSHQSQRTLIYSQTALQKVVFYLNLIAILGVVYLVSESYRRSGLSWEASDEAVIATAIAALLLVNGLLMFLAGRNQQQLEELGKDELTGAYDRSAFEILMQGEMKRAGRYHYPLALCLLAVDEFDSYRQHFGVAKGKDLLRQFSSCLIRLVRATDSVGRYDDAQFCVLLPHTDVVQAEKFLARALAQVEEQVDSGFSAGVTAYHSGETGAQLIIRANVALDQARREGKRQIRCIIGNSDEGNFLRF